MTISLKEIFQGSIILAPLTKGGNLPFRRLCVSFGADITFSEMAYARQIVRRNKRERALLRRHESESCYGVQLAALQSEEAIVAAKLAEERGANFIDINCGCPIEEVTRRGLGSALLRRPRTLERLVSSLQAALSIPVTVKLRTGWKESEIEIVDLARSLEAAGASALTIHGRTREQRYTKSADWDLIGEVVRNVSIPVVGNGDILTHYEAETRKEKSGASALMLARGALVKPWLFQEIKEGRTLDISPMDRIAVYRRLGAYMTEHFGDDELGRRRIMEFFPWHFSFFHRYVYLPEEKFGNEAAAHPLLQTRLPTMEREPIERLLSDSREEVHKLIAASILDSESDEEAFQALEKLSLSLPNSDAKESEPMQWAEG